MLKCIVRVLGVFGSIWCLSHYAESDVDTDGRPFESGFFTGSPMYHNLLFVSQSLATGVLCVTGVYVRILPMYVGCRLHPTVLQ